MAQDVAFEWDVNNIAHVKLHRVNPLEVEEVLQNGFLDLEYDIDDGEERFKSRRFVRRTNIDRCLDRKEWSYPAHHGVPSVQELPDSVFEIQGSAMKKTEIPAFRSEAAEARWWYEHREVLDRDFEKAAKAGTLKTLTREGLLKRLSSSRVISIRLPEDDLARLRRLAARNGLPYQTYMKSLLHQALEKEEKRRAG